jgi:hypothetical protein
MSDDLTVLGTDGIRRSYDEHYDTMMDVEQDPTGAFFAIQEQADRIEKLTNCVAVLEAKLSKSEALLAKAMGALGKVRQIVDEQYADRLYCQNVAGWEHCGDDLKDVARTTIAELKREK